MNSKFTPGPWTIEIEGIDKFIVGNNGASTIAHVYEKSNSKEAFYNLHLISAAPDLLEALQACQAQLTHGPEAYAALMLATAAIAKALGEHG